MTTKLTLTINDSVIKSAKVYAQKKGRSLSDLIENYLKLIAKPEVKEEEEFSPRVKRLMGSVKVPDDFDYKETLSEEIIKKHLK